MIIPHYDARRLMEKVGVKTDSIASHPLKGMGSFTKPMTEQEREILQGLVDESFTRFKDIVKHGRPKFEKNPTALDRLATGQVYTADQAAQSGLVDKVGWIEDAIDRAIELAGLTADNAHVVEYKREFSLMELSWEINPTRRDWIRLPCSRWQRPEPIILGAGCRPCSPASNASPDYSRSH